MSWRNSAINHIDKQLLTQILVVCMFVLAYENQHISSLPIACDAWKSYVVVYLLISKINNLPHCIIVCGALYKYSVRDHIVWHPDWLSHWSVRSKYIVACLPLTYRIISTIYNSYCSIVDSWRKFSRYGITTSRHI